MMTFDFATLMAVGVLTTAIAGVLTIMAWLADRGARALPWWACGYAVMAFGIACLLANRLEHGNLWIAVGMAALSLGPALMWAGARVFSGQRPSAAAIVAGPLLTLAALAIETAEDVIPVGTASQFAANATYLSLTIVTLWPYRRAGLRSCTPLIAFVGLHAAMFVAGFVETLLHVLPQRGLVGFGVVFGAIHFEQLLFAMGSSIFLVALMRERSEQRHKATAEVDALTGLATRRAFLERARHDLVIALERAEPLTLMMFDLDDFKHINDSFGHAIGDEVLRTFAQVARGRLRASDTIGRLGGEEFAVMMPGASLRAASVIANRIRRAFAESGIVTSGKTVRTTLSGGIATAESGMTLEQLLSAADAALYRAKESGRNRIELAGQPSAKEDRVVIRVA